jgi:hypothetical protein
VKETQLPVGMAHTPPARIAVRSDAQGKTQGVARNFSSIPVFPPDRKRSFGQMSEELGVREDSVRVRSDSGAVDFLSNNRAVAAAMNASTILVRPEHREDKFVMSHELVHIAQLRRGLSGSVQESENAAEAAGVNLLHGHVPGDVGSAAPPPLFLHLTGRAFDQALDNTHVSDAVIKLLRKSAPFMHIVQTLDDNYVWLNNPKLQPAPGDVVHGVLTTGPFHGRRILYIQGGAAAGSFTPFDSPDATIGADLIKINNGGADLEVVRSIAHEATHAFHLLTGSHPPTDVDASILAGVTEEIDTRKSEVSIVKDAFPARSAERNAVAQEVAAGYLSRPLVERNIAPDVGLTYLEVSGFGALLAEAQRNENLSEDQAIDIRKQMDKGPKKFPTHKGPHGFDERSKYALIYVNRKIAIATWQKFQQAFQGREDSDEAAKQKERLLQENAHALLDGRIKYSPLPRP